jgi:hypothetical protein
VRIGDARHPRGQLDDNDEGGLLVQVGVRDNTVVVAFAKPVHWIGLGAHEARGLAELLLKHAAELEV